MARGGEFNTGVCYTRPNSQGFSTVFGWQDGYDKDDTLIQQLDGEEDESGEDYNYKNFTSNEVSYFIRAVD